MSDDTNGEEQTAEERMRLVDQTSDYYEREYGVRTSR
jgi:hypothetical protein